MKKIIALLLLICMITGGCGVVQHGSTPSSINKPGSASGSGEAQSGIVSETASQAGSDAVYSLGLDYVSTGVVNPLTGQSNLPAELSGKRSVGVIINNYRTAVPHNGISKADLVFEAEAEGGITRLLALYSDYASVPKIGSIREARPYFLDLAQMADAIMLYYGADSFTNSAISARKYSCINAIRYPSLTFRDEELLLTRNKEHTVVTTGQLISDHLSKSSVRTGLLAETPAAVFSFSQDAQPLTLSRYRVRTVYLPVGGNAEYRYDAAKGVYKRYSFGSAMSDLNDGSAVELTNVLILFAKQYPNPEDTSLNCIDLTGSAGEGYYFTMGGGDKLFWQKGPNPADPIVLYDTKGNQMTLNQGKTWVNIISQDLAAQVTWSEIAS